MKNKLLSILIGLASWFGLMLAPGCSPELDFMLDSFETPDAEVSGTSISPTLLFSSEEGQATVVFHCNRRWSAAFVNDRASDWCSISGTEGRGGTVTVIVRVRQNVEFDERSASIVFTCDDVTRPLLVTQKQKDALFLSSNRVEMTYEGGDFELPFRTNVDYKITVSEDASSWITLERTKGLSSHSAYFTVAANKTLTPRQGDVIATSSAGKEVLTVYQAGEKPTLVLGYHEYVNMSARETVLSFDVESNLDVYYTLHDGSWIHEEKTKTVSTNRYRFAVDRNHSRKERTDYIVFRDREYGMCDSVHVHQLPEPILAGDLIQPEISVPSQSVVLSFLTDGGIPEIFSQESTVSWIECTGIVDDPKTGCCLVCFQTKPNRGNKPREGAVRVYKEEFDQPDEIKVTQVAVQPYFSYTTRKTEIHAPAFAQSGEGFILWGDGTFSHFDKMAANEKDVVHVYEDGKKSHSILVECAAIPWLRVSEPEDAMHFDFSTLKKGN